MDDEKQAKLKELKAKLEDLKARNPGHCSDTRTFVPHSMSPGLYRQIEELEEQINALEAE